MKKTLKNLFKLGCKIEVYVPSTQNVSESIDSTVQVEATQRFLANLFGGATSTPALGSWMCSNGTLCNEKVNIVYSYCTSEQLENNVEDVINYCENLKTDMGQEAISLGINGALYFI